MRIAYAEGRGGHKKEKHEASGSGRTGRRRVKTAGRCAKTRYTNPWGKVKLDVWAECSPLEEGEEVVYDVQYLATGERGADQNRVGLQNERRKRKGDRSAFTPKKRGIRTEGALGAWVLA